MEDCLSISTAVSGRSQDSLFSPNIFPSSALLEAKPSKLNQKKRAIRVEGHRGAGILEPENSLKAFQKAIDLGFDGVELDVWLSKDGIPIVVHGNWEDGDRIYFKDSALNIIPYELESKNLKEWKLANDEVIPTLEEVLLLAKDKIHVNIEFKGDERVVRPTLKLVMKLGMIDQVVFSSFTHKHKATLEAVRKELDCRQEIEFGFLTWLPTDFAEYLDLANKGDTLTVSFTLFLTHESLVTAEIARARARGMRIQFYFSLEQEENDEVYKKLVDLKVDGVIVNHPHKSTSYFDELVLV